MVRALIVDGDQDLLDAMACAFRHQGYEVVAAASGSQALERFRGDKPDVVVLDLELSELDGFELCRRIRLDSEVPVIAISEGRDEADILRVYRLGADDFLTKPFSLRVLAAHVEA